MDRDAIFTALDATGIPTAEDAFREDAQGADGSHAVLRHGGEVAVYADDSAYITADKWSLTLYSPSRDVASERKLKDALNKIGIPLGDSESGYDDEHRIHWCQWNFQTI